MHLFVLQCLCCRFKRVASLKSNRGSFSLDCIKAWHRSCSPALACTPVGPSENRSGHTFSRQAQPSACCSVSCFTSSLAILPTSSGSSIGSIVQSSFATHASHSSISGCTFRQPRRAHATGDSSDGFANHVPIWKVSTLARYRCFSRVSASLFLLGEENMTDRGVCGRRGGGGR